MIAHLIVACAPTDVDNSPIQTPEFANDRVQGFSGLVEEGLRGSK